MFITAWLDEWDTNGKICQKPPNEITFPYEFALNASVVYVLSLRAFVDTRDDSSQRTNDVS